MTDRRFLVALAALPLLGATPVATQPGLPAALTCTDPVKPLDSAASLLVRLGANARIETYQDEYGDVDRIVLLWPDDPAQRLEVTFWDEGLTQVARVMAVSQSRWRVVGLGNGDDWLKVAAINGRAFEFGGYGRSDSGGSIHSFKGGKLELLPGGCVPVIWLAKPAARTPALMVTKVLMSNDPALRGQHLTIDGIGYVVPLRQK